MAIEGYMSGWTPDHVEEDRPPEDEPPLCEMCGGNGSVERWERVSRSMALDAGDPSMEGMPVRWGDEQCPACHGSGYAYGQPLSARAEAARIRAAVEAAEKFRASDEAGLRVAA